MFVFETNIKAESLFCWTDFIVATGIVFYFEESGVYLCNPLKIFIFELLIIFIALNSILARSFGKQRTFPQFL